MDFLSPHLKLLALELHFSSVPAQLGLVLLRQATAYYYQSINQFTRNNWEQAIREWHQLSQTLSPDLAPITNIRKGQYATNWEHWQNSRPKACHKVQELTLNNKKILENLLIYGSPTYPSSLYRLFHPPFTLFFKGSQNIITNENSGFAVCGSRKVTLQGRSDAFALAYGVCSSSHFYLVSGLSEGIELAACEGALAAQKPIVGVLCCGFDAMAPPESLQMATRIVNTGGLLLSEYPPAQPRQSYTFLQRNRILAALAASLLFAELGPKTKALNLVDYALELNHDIAVLGDSAGVQRLREQGCAHWPNANALLQALGMKCEMNAPQYSQDNNKIGKTIADSIYEELLEQSEHYLGRQIKNTSTK